ncbi:unnamed protein product [Caenorhabditis angaria]|uniref:Neurotransmitter-gated ion-channel ligand-binding domain-containing protein n=1 Tax=Caenorhabditis angaria TaxID=860376 RepID=A0A9P1IBZ8_9PELO|nr:unnamed protein product [Caenorhabditis angaria]
MIRFIVTLCILLISVDATDFTVQEQMICNIQGEWKYWVRYLEYDYGTPNDKLLETAWEYGNGNSHGPRRVRQFSISGGDGWFDGEYEIEMEVFHTCTNTGTETSFYVKLGDVQVDTRHKNFNVAGIVLDSQCNFAFCWLVKLLDWINYILELCPVLGGERERTFYVWTYDIRIIQLKVFDLDEPREQLSVSLQALQSWYDLRLQWNASEFRDIRKLYVRQDMVWSPPFGVFSASDVKDHRDQDFRMVEIHSDSMITSNIPMRLTINCNLHMENFPFDEQICEIRSGVATIYYRLYRIRILVPKETRENYCDMGNSAWDVIQLRTGYLWIQKESAEYSSTQQAVIRITLKRNPLFYMYMIILPTFIINLIAISGVFLQKSSAMDRLTICLTHIMTMTFILGLIAEKIPKTMEIPLLGKYIIFGLCSMIFAISTSIAFGKSRFSLIFCQILNFSSFFYMIWRYLEFVFLRESGVRGNCVDFSNNVRFTDDLVQN